MPKSPKRWGATSVAVARTPRFCAQSRERLSASKWEQAMPEFGARSGWTTSLTDRFDLSRPGLVVLKTGKVELGQGILLALRQIAAEELDLTMDAVVTVSGDTSASPVEGGTVGSMSV